MKKPDRNYFSLYDFLGITKPPADRPKEYSKHGFHYHDNSIIPEKEFHDPVSISGYQLLGSLNPFFKIGKDIKNFFKPYPNTNKAVFDLLKPVTGIKNILKGVGSFIGSAIAFAGWTAAAPFALLGCALPKVRDYCKPFFSQILSYLVSWMVEGVGDILFGATQILISPLTLPIRLPMRGIITVIEKQSGKTFLAEDKPSIQRLAIEAYSQLDHVNPHHFMIRLQIERLGMY